MKFKTTIKFLVFSIISILNLNLLYAQDFGRLAISNFTFKKGNQAAEIIYSTKIIALVSMKGGKIICQINEEKIGQYSYVKYDEKAQFIEEGTFRLPEVAEKAYAKILNVEWINDRFFIYYESQGKPNTHSYIQYFSEKMEPVGNRILLTSEEIGIGFLTTLFSKDRSKFCIFKTGNTGKVKNKRFSDPYIVFDLASNRISKLSHNYTIEKGFKNDLDVALSNDGNISIFYKISESEEETQGFRYAVKRIGNGIDSSEFKVPFDDIWLRDSKIDISADILTICCSYKARDKKSKLRFIPDFLTGLAFSKIDLRARKEVSNGRILFESILQDKKTFLFKEGALSYYGHNFNKVNFNNDGSIDLTMDAVRYITTTSTPRNSGVFEKIYIASGVEEKASLPIYLNITSDLRLNFFKALNLSSCSNSGFHIKSSSFLVRKGKESMFIMLADTTSKIEDVDVMTCMTEKKMKLTTFKFKENGSFEKFFEAPYEVRKKVYLDLDFPYLVNGDNGKVYFYAKNYTGYAMDYILTSYTLP